MKKKIQFKIIEFLYKYKLFGIHKKCWADLVIYTHISGDWHSVTKASKCGYCGACMTDKELEERGMKDKEKDLSSSN